MKIKGLLISMLACTALVGCTNSDDVLENGSVDNGGNKKFAINIPTKDMPKIQIILARILSFSVPSFKK